MSQPQVIVVQQRGGCLDAVKWLVGLALLLGVLGCMGVVGLTMLGASLQPKAQPISAHP